MKILIVTGQLAKDIVLSQASKASKETGHQVDVLVLPIQVAALTTTSYIAKALSSMSVKERGYDLIMIPGLAIGSADEITNALEVKAVKGPKQAADIYDVLTQADFSKLKPDKPADEVLAADKLEKAKKTLQELEDALIKSGKFYQVGKLRVPLEPPPIRVISELPEAHAWSKEDLLQEALRLISSGADALSIGFEAGNPRPDIVHDVVKFLREHVDVPLAIDSVIPSEIKSGVEAGADIVLSIDLSNLEKVYRQVRDKLCITIPADVSKGFVPSSPEDRVKLLSSIIDRAKELGIEKLMADPILDAAINPGFTKSLSAFYMFRLSRRDVPLFMGVGNVVELLDADSVGMNALLAMAALEVGATMLLTVEKSNKAKGSTLECSLAAKMASIAYVRKIPPKALGIDLLMLKEKKLYEVPIAVNNAEILQADEAPRREHADPQGSLKISVNHKKGVIEAYYIGRLGAKLIEGKTAKAVLDKVLSLGLVSTIGHAAYLGRELEKAEIALKLRRSYLQEENLFQDKVKLLKELSTS